MSTSRPAEPARVNANGIVTQDGRQIDLDVIIYATGYHLDFLSTMDIRGRDGLKLSEEWGDSPSAYRGGTVPGFPNLFITSAPNYSPGHGAGAQLLGGGDGPLRDGVPAVDGAAQRHHDRGDAARRSPDYVREIDEAMAGTVWCHTPNAHTYYRSAGGRIVTAFPFRLVDVWQSHRAPIEEDFILQ